jgi:hypothetical protein
VAAGVDAGSVAKEVGEGFSTVDQVQTSAVGKYCNELSGFLVLYSAALLANAGQALLQLA